MHSMCLMQVRYVARNTRKVSMHVMYVVHVRYAVYVKMKLDAQTLCNVLYAMHVCVCELASCKACMQCICQGIPCR